MSLSFARPMDSDVLQDGEGLLPPVGLVNDLKHGRTRIIGRRCFTRPRPRPSPGGPAQRRPRHGAAQRESDARRRLARRDTRLPRTVRRGAGRKVQRRTASAAASDIPRGRPRTTSTSVTLPAASIGDLELDRPFDPGPAREVRIRRARRGSEPPPPRRVRARAPGGTAAVGTGVGLGLRRARPPAAPPRAADRLRDSGSSGPPGA